MAQRKRYLVSSRVGARRQQHAWRAVRDFIRATAQADIVRATPGGRQVMTMPESHAALFAATHPELLLEPDPPLRLFRMPGLPDVIPSEGEFELPVIVRDGTRNSPIANVTVYGIGAGAAPRAVTDAAGRALLRVHEPQLRRVIASPADTYWSKYVDDVDAASGSALSVMLNRLPVTGQYGWGQRLMRFDRVHPAWTGDSVSIAVIDSGISSHATDIVPRGGYNTLDAGPAEAWNVDEKGHGTHVAGLVAAVPHGIGVLGAAPGAHLYSVKVFPGGHLSDLVEAVEWSILARVDLINLSLGSQMPSAVLAQVIGEAYSRGITCIAAVGNDRTEVAFPAALPTVLGVGAVGRWGTFPSDSAHVLKGSVWTDWFSALFAAGFSNFGYEVDVCAPGVAVLSTVPTGYASWDGTSMAAPLVTALAARLLQACPSIRTGDAQQVEILRAILLASAVNVRLPLLRQGRGVPWADRALRAAMAYVGASERGVLSATSAG
jgi:subtilisin family serine protease